ncbi:MAG: amidohydrolase family protein [Saprospiraceae bacterium]
MKLKFKHLLFLCSLLMATQAFSQPAISSLPSAEEIAFVNVNVLPMSGKQVLMNQTVIVKNGKISQMGAAKSVKPSKNALIIKAKGKYLMPGLAEMHAHIPVAQNGDDSNVRETLFLYLAGGVTTIRGMLGHPYHLQLKEQLAKNEVLGPRTYTSSPSLNGNSVKTPEEARAKVTQYQKEGFDFLKIHPGIELPVFEALVQTAREVGITFSGHVPIAVGVRRAIDFGYASIDHIDGYVEGLVPTAANVDPNAGGLFGIDFTHVADIKIIPDLVAKTKEKGIWVVPTQALLERWTSPMTGDQIMAEPEMAYMNPSVRYQWRGAKAQILGANYDPEKGKKFVDIRRQLLKQMHQAGVGLLLGSDAPQIFNVPGFSIRHEAKAMADAGIPNYEILKSGTVNPAKFFQQEGEFGVVKIGAAAELILLDANPLENISNIKSLQGVLIQGRWLPKKMIDEALAKIAKKYEKA